MARHLPPFWCCVVCLTVQIGFAFRIDDESGDDVLSAGSDEQNQLEPQPYSILHTHGYCISRRSAQTTRPTIETCAEHCQETSYCNYFAFNPLGRDGSAEWPGCRVYSECGTYDESAQYDHIDAVDPSGNPRGWDFTTYEMKEPGFVENNSRIPETMSQRHASSIAEAEEHACSQHRETWRTCLLFGCRGGTECISGRCLCATGSCLNDRQGCVTQDEYHNLHCEDVVLEGELECRYSYTLGRQHCARAAIAKTNETAICRYRNLQQASAR